MKKLIYFISAMVMTFCLVGCGGQQTQNNTNVETAPENNAETKVEVSDKKELKIGVVLVGDENEGYTYAHIGGIETAISELGISKNSLIYKYKIPDNEQCYDECIDLVEQGCNLVITNSYGHQSYCQQAAEEHPEVEFVAMTGDTAKLSGLQNFHNAFTKIYEARYCSGIVAGMKLQELIDNNKLTDNNKDKDGNYKLGYVGAFPFAEVVSGYTAFYLGVKSIVPNVVMDVQYTNSWFDITGEREAAIKLLSDGCVILSQHSDSTGAPSAVEEYYNAGNTCFCVGYNVDMLSIAPNAALVSAKNNWKNCYKYIFENAKEGKKFSTDWSEGYAKDSVLLSQLGSSCAAGTKEKVGEVENLLKEGKLQVFDINNFTVNGEKVTHAFATDTDGDFVNDADEAIINDAYYESYYRSAPSFSLRIDGITELNN